MSSLDSDLNAMATVVVNDFSLRLSPKLSDSQQLLVGKFSVIFMGLVSIALAIQWVQIGSASLVEFALTLMVVFTGGILGLFGLGMLVRWATAVGANLGIISCVVFTAWAILTQISFPPGGTPILDLGRFNCSLSFWLIGVLGHLILLVVGMAASWFFPDSSNQSLTPSK